MLLAWRSRRDAHYSQVQAEVKTHRLYGLHRFGEVIAGVYEYHFYVLPDLGGEVDEHAVLHGRGDADVGGEGAQRPLDDVGGFPVVKLSVEIFKLGDCVGCVPSVALGYADASTASADAAYRTAYSASRTVGETAAIAQAVAKASSWAAAVAKSFACPFAQQAGVQVGTGYGARVRADVLAGLGAHVAHSESPSNTS